METKTITIHTEYIELNQLLKLAGACNSGGEGKMLVAEGLVNVNGEQELRKTCKIRSGQVVHYGDLEIHVSHSSDRS